MKLVFTRSNLSPCFLYKINIFLLLWFQIPRFLWILSLILKTFS